LFTYTVGNFKSSHNWYNPWSFSSLQHSL
jgi:hypothetical protein